MYFFPRFFVRFDIILPVLKNKRFLVPRMINYWWNNSSTVSRIAKSLQVASHVEDAKNLRSERNLEENGAYMRSNSTLGTMGQCAQYVCSPKNLLKKFLSPKTPSSQLPLKNDES